MKDTIIKGNGKSRVIKAPSSMPSTFTEWRDQVIAGKAYLDVNLNSVTSGDDAGCDVIGTPYSKAAGLDDTTKTALGLTQTDPTINNALYGLALKTDGLQIGGANVLRGTNTVASLTSTGVWSNGTWRKSGTSDIEKIAITDAPNPDIKYGWKTTGTGTTLAIAQDGFPLPLGYEYTISCYARVVSGSPTFSLQYGNTGGYKYQRTPITNSEWKKYSYTFTTAVNSGTIFIGTYLSTGVVEICGEKLEFGNKATDWSPSPRDVDTAIAAIADAAQKVTGISVNQDLNSLVSNYTKVSAYQCLTNTTAATLSNCPTTLAFSLMFYPTTAAGGVQLLQTYPVNATRKIYQRTVYNNSWSAWSEIYLSDNMPVATTAQKGIVQLTDIYEEGTWTPQIYGLPTSATVSNITSYGNYSTVGNLTTITWYYGASVDMTSAQYSSNLMLTLPITTVEQCSFSGRIAASQGFLQSNIGSTYYNAISGATYMYAAYTMQSGSSSNSLSFTGASGRTYIELVGSGTYKTS